MVICGKDHYLNMQEAAAMLGCSVGTIERRIETGKILGSFKMGRKRVIPLQNIEKYITNQKKAGGVL